jgi:hypothetical protein
MTARPAVEEAWRQLDDTLCAYQPRLELPPADLETRDTSPYLPPVRFFGEPVRYSASETRPLPANCQHALASALDDLTRDLTPTKSVAAPVAAVRQSTAPVPDVRGNVSSAGAVEAFAKQRSV